MAYRSGPARGGHIEGLDELEAKLRRGVRIRRLVMGFLALVTGLVLIVLGVLITVKGREFHGRALRIPIAMVIGGVFLAGAAFVILRIGEIRDRDGLEVHEVDPIPWSTLGLVSAGILVVTGLVAAYPLGIYTWAWALKSPCRSVLSAKDVATLGLAPYEVGDVTNDQLRCTMTGREARTNLRIVEVTLAGDQGGGQFENLLRFYDGKRTPLPGLGDEAYLVERRGESIILVRRRHAAMLVHLASRLYDHDASLRIAKHLETKVPLLEPYADAWKKRYGNDF